MELTAHLALWVLSQGFIGDLVLSPMVGWEQPLCICRVLEERLRGQLYQAPVIKRLLASTLVTVFWPVYGVDPWVG